MGCNLVIDRGKKRGVKECVILGLLSEEARREVQIEVHAVEVDLGY